MTSLLHELPQEAAGRAVTGRRLRDLSSLSPFSSAQGAGPDFKRARPAGDGGVGMREQEPSACSELSTQTAELSRARLRKSCSLDRPGNAGGSGQLGGARLSSAFSPVPSMSRAARLASYKTEPAPRPVGRPAAPHGSPQSAWRPDASPTLGPRLPSAPATLHAPRAIRFTDVPPRPHAWQAGRPQPVATLQSQLSEPALRALLLCGQRAEPPPPQTAIDPELLRSLEMLHQSQQMLALAMATMRRVPSASMDPSVARHKRKLADMGLHITRKVESYLARGEDFALRAATQRCALCGTDRTPVWRRLKGHNSDLVCNACGLKKRRTLLHPARREGKQTTPGARGGSGGLPEALVATAIERPTAACAKQEPAPAESHT